MCAPASRRRSSRSWISVRSSRTRARRARTARASCATPYPFPKSSTHTSAPRRSCATSPRCRRTRCSWASSRRGECARFSRALLLAVRLLGGRPGACNGQGESDVVGSLYPFWWALEEVWEGIISILGNWMMMDTYSRGRRDGVHIRGKHDAGRRAFWFSSCPMRA